MTDFSESQSKLESFAKERQIKFIVLFGSQAQETSRERSDFDVAVYLAGGRSLFDEARFYLEFQEKLAEFFEVEVDKIDLTDLARANILFRYEITSRGQLLCGEELDYLEYKAFAFRDYMDARPLFRLEELLINKRQQLIKEVLRK